MPKFLDPVVIAVAPASGTHAANKTYVDGRPKIEVFTIPGTLIVGAGAEIPMPFAMTITNVRVRIKTAPTGASAIFDLNKNGTTMFTTQGNRPTVTAGNNQDLSSVPDVTSLAAGDYLSVDCDQIGSTVAGANAVLVVEYT